MQSQEPATTLNYALALYLLLQTSPDVLLLIIRRLAVEVGLNYATVHAKQAVNQSPMCSAPCVADGVSYTIS